SITALSACSSASCRHDRPGCEPDLRAEPVPARRSGSLARLLFLLLSLRSGGRALTFGFALLGFFLELLELRVLFGARLAIALRTLLTIIGSECHECSFRRSEIGNHEAPALDFRCLISHFGERTPDPPRTPVMARHRSASNASAFKLRGDVGERARTAIQP